MMATKLMKKMIILLAVVAVGWAAWYYFIREKTPGEKLDDATRKVEKTVDDAVKKVTK